MTNRVGVAVLVAGLAIGVVAQAHAEPGITRLEYNPVSNLIHVVAARVSDDGAVVVAWMSSVSGQSGYWWKRSDSWSGMSFGYGIPTGIDSDGSHVAVTNGPDVGQGVYSESDGLVNFSAMPGSPAISADGNVVVGHDILEAVRWVNLQPQDLGPFVTVSSATNDVGSVVFGYGHDSGDTFLWRWEDGDLVRLENSTIDSGDSGFVRDCNRAGTIAVGNLGGESTDPYRWNQLERVLLATNGNIYTAHYPYSLNETGELIVGSTSNFGETAGGTALIWINNDTLMTLAEFIEAEGIDTTGWVLNRATDMTPDGKFIVGGGQYNGINSGFIIERDIGNTCPPDLTGDGTLDFFDIQAFLAAFAASDPVADFNNDTVFDFFDVQAYLAAFAEGCP